ncbi:MAG: hypothetical protein FWD57_17155, partial [Polyangiaceae bacterium]|nr:hypothetical protein [Polyangiaceae bacterium]
PHWALGAIPLFFSGCAMYDYGELPERESKNQSSSAPASTRDRREGGQGVRARGEEGSMGDRRQAEIAELMQQIESATDRAAQESIKRQIAEMERSEARAAAPPPSPPRATTTSQTACAPGDPMCWSDDVRYKAAPKGGEAKPDKGDAFTTGAGEREAAEFGMIGLLLRDGANAEGNRAKNEPASGGFLGDLERDSQDVPVVVAALPHVVSGCPDSANLQLADRAALWKERLAVAASARTVANVFDTAIVRCEAPTWNDRSKLLNMMLDSLPSVTRRLELWALMQRDRVVADTLYRGIIVRIRNVDQLRELHQGLGLARVDTAILDAVLRKDLPERVAKLREFRAKWPDDHVLALELIYALEDLGDDDAARYLARELRGRPDVDAHVLTEVGELFLRLSKRGSSTAQSPLDEAEARRAFGEIVEFAPEDRVARRRLGDLLRAHGWFEEAVRQYETLAVLAPEDMGVSLLRAASVQGLGKLQEAVNEADKLSRSGAPGDAQGLSNTARAMSAVYLAWGRVQAAADGKQDSVELLRKQTERLVLQSDRSDKAVRVVLMWSHPGFFPTLWHNSAGLMTPAPDGDVTLGVSQVVLQRRDGIDLEIRLDPKDARHAARLGSEMILTVIFDEGRASEKVVKMKVVFERGGPSTLRFRIEGNEAKQ